MKLKRDVLITTMLRYQEAFLKLLDYINQGDNDGAYAIPVQLYYHQYSSFIIPKAKLNDDLNAINHLTIESLLENGVFLKNEKQSGMLVLQSVIVELIRFIDVNRARELNRKDFELMRANLEESVKQVTRTQIGSEDYRDAMLGYHEVMNSIHSKIKENAERLGVKVDELASDYKSLKTNSLDATVDVNELYKRVNHLYSRYVLPCFEFLNATPLVAKDNFSDAVEQIIEWHESFGDEHTTTAQKIGFSKTAISSYYKDISEYEQKLKQYSTSLESDRRAFIAIEASYTQLMDSIQERRHGMGRGFKLTPESPVFSHLNGLDGLIPQYRFRKKLSWDEYRSIRRIEEYMLYIDSLEKPVQKKSLNQIQHQVSQDSLRQEQIGSRILALNLTANTEDVHQTLHSMLSVDVEDYSLIDLLHALESFIPINMEKIIWDEVEPKRIEDDTYYLNYLPIKWSI